VLPNQHNQSEEWPDHPDVTGSGEKFVPYATMFKLNTSDSDFVNCINCNAPFPLQDLLEHELNEDQCPECKVWDVQYWKEKPHRKVPHAR